jgi:hypothetical protein
MRAANTTPNNLSLRVQGASYAVECLRLLLDGRLDRELLIASIDDERLAVVLEDLSREGMITRAGQYYRACEFVIQYKGKLLMNPSTLTKPVMDVAAPKSPGLPISSPLRRWCPTSLLHYPSALAPFAPSTLQSAPATPLPMQQTTHTPGKAACRSAAFCSPYASCVITVTVFVMLVLSALAVTVYMTSQTA